jgi:broad specificity phosphatase PhoE
VERHGGERVIVFTHGAVINAYLGTVLGVDGLLRVYPEYTSITIVRGRGVDRSVVCINDTAHLHEVATAPL